MTEPVIAVVGPTAAGKSELALRLAVEIGGEIVNADSMQLYTGMDIGTAKLPVAQRRGVPHHLLDIWDVRQTASVAEYQRLARDAIADIQRRGLFPVLAGGSGLYLRAALDPLRFPGTDPALRARLEAELAQSGAAALHRRLTGLDPAVGLVGAGAGVPGGYGAGLSAEPAGIPREAPGVPGEGGIPGDAVNLPGGGAELGIAVVFQEVARNTAAGACLKLGRILADRAPRVALLAMGDACARPARGDPDVPDPAARDYDEEVAEALAAADARWLARLDPAADDELVVAGRAAWQVLAGAARGTRMQGQLLCMAAPYGVTYLVASWEQCRTD